MRMSGLSAKTREHFRRDGQAKYQYTSRRAADLAAKVAGKRAYRCAFCGRWHIGGTA